MRHISLLLLIFIVNLLSPVLYAKPVVWKIQSHKPAASVLFNIEQQLAEELAFATQGQLLLIIKPDKGYRGIRETFNSVRRGDIDGMFMTPQYWGGANPVFTILGDLVAAWNSPDQYRQWLFEQNGIRHLEKAYDNFGLKLISYSISPAESIVSTKAIENIADFKGQVMRSPPGMVSDFFKVLGARPRNITLSKTAEALAKGRVRMADYSYLVDNVNLKLYATAKHTNYPGFHSMPLYDFVVRKKSWQGISDKHKLAVKKVMSRWDTIVFNSTRFQLERALKVAKSEGVTLHRWDESETKAARRLAVKVWDDYGRKNVKAQQLIDELKSWLTLIGNI